MTQCFRWVMSAGVCVLPFLTTKDFGLLAEQETEVLPDQTLLQLVEDAECERKNAHYLEFLLALAICNTVVVSTKAARRQRVREMIMLTLPLLLRTALCTHELCHSANNSLDVKIIALIVHHAQWLLLEAEYMCPEILLWPVWLILLYLLQNSSVLLWKMRIFRCIQAAIDLFLLYAIRTFSS